MAALLFSQSIADKVIIGHVLYGDQGCIEITLDYAYT